MDRTEAEKFLLGGMASEPAAAAPPQGLERPSMAGANVVSQANWPEPPKPTNRYQQEAMQITGGVPVDQSQGLDALSRFALSFRDDKKSQIDYLKNKYGDDAIKMDPQGAIIVRIQDEAGKPKYVPIDENQLSGKDILDVVGIMPEMLGAFIGMRGGRSIPKLGQKEGTVGLLRDAVTGALGSAAVGASKDVGVSLLDKGEADVGDILKKRGAMAVLDTGMGVGMGLGAKALGRTITPMDRVAGESDEALNSRLVQTQGEQAREYWKNRAGIETPATPGEITGNKFMQRVEAIMKKYPGSSAVYDKIRAQQEAAFRQMQNVAMGLPKNATKADLAGIPSDRAVGAEIINTIEPELQAIKSARDAAHLEAIQAASEELLGEITKAVPGTTLYKSQVGQAIRAKATALRDAFTTKSRELYEAAKSLPGGRDRILVAPNIANDAKSLIKSLPQKNVLKEVPTGILDSSGKEIVSQVRQAEVLKEFVPDNVLNKLNSLKDLKGQKFSLQDLIQMRNEVSNDIAVGQSIPNAQTHYLGQIRDLLTKAINESTDALPDGQLKKAWQTANSHYADNVGKFHGKGVSKILKEADAPGYIGDSEIVGRLTSNSEAATDLFKELQGLMGPSSPEFAALKRSIADEMIAKASQLGGKTIDAGAFQKALRDMYANNREMAEEVFGKNIRGIANMLDLTGKVQAKGAKVTPEILSEVMAGGSPAKVEGAFRKALAAQTKQDNVYKNKILKAIADGDVDKIGIDPEEFVSRFYDNAKVEQVKGVLSQLQDNPEILQRLRQKVVQKLFYDASRKPVATDPILLADDPAKLPSTESLMKAIGGEEGQKKLRAILGNETFRDIEQFAKAMRPSEAIDTAFAAAGGIGAGMQISSLFKMGDLSYLDRFVKQKVGAIIFSNPLTRRYFSNKVIGPEGRRRMLMAAITSEPFVRDLTLEYGEKGAAEVMDQINGSMNRYDAEHPADQESERRKAAEQFLQGK